MANNRWSANIMPRVVDGLLVAALLVILPCPANDLSGRNIMDEIVRRHEQHPYTYEQQTLIMMDAAGERDTRKLRRFSRVDPDGTQKYLLVFDNPVDVRGVALLATRSAGGAVESRIYLPAFGQILITTSGDARSSRFLGTDFALEDLTAEFTTDFRYIRREDAEFDRIHYFVVDAFPMVGKIESITDYARRRHFVRQDNLLVTRTDYFDRQDRLLKRRTRHDLKQVDGEVWRADMMLMQDFRHKHKTLIKIDKRVFSQDYVPVTLFTASGVLEHRHVEPDGRRSPSPPDTQEQSTKKAARGQAPNSASHSRLNGPGP